MTWFVYRNIRRKIWSLRKRGKVVGHARGVTLLGCTFKVSESGRQRVLLTQQKNVHAGVSARVMHTEVPVSWPWPDAVEVTYNPYKHATFVRRDTGEPVFSAQVVVLDSDGKAWIGA